jgi:hypothetical protein
MVSVEPDVPEPRSLPFRPLPPPPPLPPAAAPVASPASAARRAPRQRSGLAAFLRNNVVVVLVAAVVVGVGGVALATGKPSRPSVDLTSAPAMADTSPPAAAAPAGPTSANGPSASAPAAASAGAAPITPAPPAVALAERLFRLGHGQATVTVGKRQVTVTFDAGTVTGLSYGAITVTRRDGTTVTVAIDNGTRFGPNGRHPKVGDRAIVYSTGANALRITSAPPASAAPSGG